MALRRGIIFSMVDQHLNVVKIESLCSKIVTRSEGLSQSIVEALCGLELRAHVGCVLRQRLHLLQDLPMPSTTLRERKLVMETERY
eukprot:3593295-Rhodomonas_salina.2